MLTWCGLLTRCGSHFPMSSDHVDAPVLNWDLMGDLAVIGPLQTSIDPVALVDGEDLIGYPGEVERFPEPTLSRGLISRLREWDAIGMTYFQTDASIAGGQSGGVLVSEDGDVIGITGFFFGEQGFSLAASASDVLTRVEKLIAGEDVDGLGDRRISLEGGQLEHNITLNNVWHQRMYVINESAGTAVDVELEGESDDIFGLFDLYGDALILVDDGLSGVESGSATTQLNAPHLLIAAQFSEVAGEFRLSSNRSLAPFDDPDDGMIVAVGETVVAGVDYPGDVDYFEIELEEGQTIDISVDSVLVDSFLNVDYLRATVEQVVDDDDSGGGLFGLNAKVTYRAPHTGSYFIAIQSSIVSEVGGYFLTVAQAPAGATPALVPTPAPIATIASPFGPMALYESAQYPFAIQYPAAWTEQPPQPELGIVASFAGEQNAILIIVEEDLEASGFGEMTLEEYGDAIIATAEANGAVLVSREQITTAQSLPAELVEYSVLGGAFASTRVIFLHEDKMGFGATYLAPKARHEELALLIEYSLSTFRVREPGQEVQDAAFYLLRGDFYGFYFGEFLLAIEDYSEAIRLNPEHAGAYNGRGITHWLLRKFDQAIEDLNQSIALDEGFAGAYNNRALVHAALGDYDQALADVTKSLELLPDTSNLIDTRGYVYLKLGQYENAKLDYEELFERGLESPYYLLGGGVAYADLGESDKASPLLEQGLEETEAVTSPDPQLADLIAMAEEALAELQ